MDYLERCALMPVQPVQEHQKPIIETLWQGEHNGRLYRYTRSANVQDYCSWEKWSRQMIDGLVDMILQKTGRQG